MTAERSRVPASSNLVDNQGVMRALGMAGITGLALVVAGISSRGWARASGPTTATVHPRGRRGDPAHPPRRRSPCR